MRQVAQMAGVSAMTVSKALGNKPGVSAETRKRIAAAARKLNYMPNLLAKSFRTDRTNTIGVIMSSGFENVFTMLFQGIEAAAAEIGFSTLLATTADDLEKEREIIEMLASKRVDGLVLTSALHFSEKLRLRLEQLGIPYVLTVRSYPDPSVTTICNNNYAGAREMMEYLIASGSRRFLLLPMEQARCSTAERLRGWGESLAAHGLSVPPERVAFVDPDIDGGYEAMKKRIRKRRDWDTVVCGNDTIAIGAMEALLEAGVDIPGQVRISGYDGIPLSPYVRVPLTTVEQPLYQMGRAGMRLLAHKMRDPGQAAQQVVMNSKLVVRRST